jgi:hypothetical protein
MDCTHDTAGVIEHEHQRSEDCLTCRCCGKCREDLDETDLCPDCGGET